MKKTKIGTLLVAAFAATTLAGWGCSKNDDDMVYRALYSYDAETLNYMDTNKSEDSDVFASLVDGLVETDKYGTITPALATSWSQSTEDTRVWTFNIRQGVKWVTSKQKEYAEVTAEDWVTSLKYAIQSDDMNYLITMFINNSQEYLDALEYDAATTDAERIATSFFRTFAKGKYNAFDALSSYYVFPTIGETNFLFDTEDTGVAHNLDVTVNPDWVGKTIAEVFKAAEISDKEWISSLSEEDEYYVNKEGKWVLGTTVTETKALVTKTATITWNSAADQAAFTEKVAFYKNFANVGVKAVDKYTLQYTTYEEQNYFVSALLHSAYYPANAAFIEEVGFDAFGTTIEKMLYCGPHILKVWDLESQVVLVKNEKYWDKENVFLDKVILKKYDASTYSQNDGYTRDLFEKGEIDGFAVSSNDTDGWKKYVTGSNGEGTMFNPANANAYSYESEFGTGSSFLLFFNRDFDQGYIKQYPNLFASSTLTDAEVALGNAALDIKEVRQALVYGLDRSYAQESNWSDDYINKDQYLSSTYVPKEFAVDENGKDYVEYYAENYAIKTGMTVAEATEKLQPGKDGITDLAKARTLLASVKDDLATLAAEYGLTLPIKLEYAGLPDSESVAYDTEMVASWNNDLKLADGTEVIKIVRNSNIETEQQYLYHSNYAEAHLVIMGWGPDYADPLTYLDTLTTGGAFADFAGILGSDDPVVTAYDDMVAAANAEKLSSKRLEKFAAAEYYAVYEAAIAIPWYIPGRGTRVGVSRVIPYQVMKSSVGCVSNKYKFMKVSKKPIGQEKRNELKAEYDAGK